MSPLPRWYSVIPSWYLANSSLTPLQPLISAASEVSSGNSLRVSRPTSPLSTGMYLRIYLNLNMSFFAAMRTRHPSPLPILAPTRSSLERRRPSCCVLRVAATGSPSIASSQRTFKTTTLLQYDSPRRAAPCYLRRDLFAEGVLWQPRATNREPRDTVREPHGTKFGAS